MIYQERWYQEEASDSMIEDVMPYFLEPELNGKINPICVAPPGTGKSLIPCKVIDEFLSKFPTKKVLSISHVESVLEQNHTKLVEFFEGIRIGLYSAGIGMKQIEQITVVGIQSAYKTPEIFGDVGLIIIDECHLTAAEKGMYYKFLKNFPDAVVAGFTATPWGKGGVSLLEVDSPVFNKISYDISEYSTYNRLVDEGFLVPLIPLPTDFNLDEEGLRLIGGEFSEGDMSEKFDNDEVSDQICSRVAKYGKKYKKWLVFAIDIEHAENLAKKLCALGFPVEAVYTGSKRSKVEVIEDLRRGDLRGVVNVGMMTTGLDIPAIDLIVWARLTNSPIFWVQGNGRGTRPVYADGFDLNEIEGRLASIKQSGKTHTLVLDFGRNARRLGPINGIEAKKKKLGKGVSSIMAKSCKNCGTDNHLRALNCIACNEEFEFAVKIKTLPSAAKIVKGKEPKEVVDKRWLDVKSVEYALHHKHGSPQMMKMTYHCAMISVTQYICLDHKGYPRELAKGFVRNRYRGSSKKPNSVRDLWAVRHDLFVPMAIKVEAGAKDFLQVADTKFHATEKFPPNVKVYGLNDLQTPSADAGAAGIFAQIRAKMNRENKKERSVEIVQVFDDDIPF